MEYTLVRGHEIGKDNNILYLERICNMCGEKAWIKDPGKNKRIETVDRRCISCYRKCLNPWRDDGNSNK